MYWINDRIKKLLVFFLSMLSIHSSKSVIDLCFFLAVSDLDVSGLDTDL
jgi:hypothetical protein